MKSLMFVYGTLRRSFSNHHLLGRSPFLGGARTSRAYALYVGAEPYPLCVADEAVAPIVGEVYKVDPATLMVLDALEGHPHLYRRQEVEVVLDDGRTLTAWLYFAPRPTGGRRLTSGDWSEVSGEGG